MKNSLDFDVLFLKIANFEESLFILLKVYYSNQLMQIKRLKTIHNV